MLFLNYTVKKKNCENQKKIDRQLVMSRTSLTIKHVEKGPKNTGNAPAQLQKFEFFAGLNKIFSKGRVIAKSRLTSNETCYLYGRFTSHLRYVQACLNQRHFETWQVSLFGSTLHIGKSLRIGKNSIAINPVSPIYSLRELFFLNYFLAYFEEILVASYPG